MEDDIFKRISSIGELIETINIDADVSKANILEKRYPIRLIFLSSIEVFKELLSCMTDIRRVDITEHLSGENDWITPDKFIGIIKQQKKNESFIMTSFSEVIRFYSVEEFNSIMGMLVGLENTEENCNRRIYLPMIGMSNRYKKYVTNTSRMISKQWAPLWEVKGNFQQINLNITSFDIKNSNFNDTLIIRNIKQWLNLWHNMKESNNEIICCSDILSYRHKNTLPDEIFTINKIDNPKAFIENIYKINIPYNIVKEDFEKWEQLLEKIGNILEKRQNTTCFYEIVCNIFNQKEIDFNSFIKLWFEYTEPFYRWVLKIYVLSNYHNSYISYVLSDVNAFEDIQLFKMLFTKIFDDSLFKNNNLVEERKHLICSFYSINPLKLTTDVEQYIKNQIDNQLNDGIKIKLITGVLNFEKEYLIDYVKQDIDNLEDLKGIYENLYYYLSDIRASNNITDESLTRDYFYEYRLSKISDYPSDKLKEILLSKNIDSKSFYSWYFKFPAIDSILEKNKVDNVFWIDALGVEWSSLVVEELRKRGYFSKVFLTIANLPTITSCRTKYNSTSEIYEFDRLVHSDIYHFPSSFIDELECVSNIVKQLPLVKGKKYAIITDHGLSVFPRLEKSYKKHSFSFSEHEGRCYKIPENEVYKDTEDYIICCDNPNKEKYLASLRYTSLYEKPKREVHGGLTPEEVIIPVFIFSDDESKVKTKKVYKVSIPQRELYKQENIVINVYTNESINIIVFDMESNKRLKVNRDGNSWIVEAFELKEGKHSLRININDYEEIIDINIKGGLTIDDGF